MTLYKAIAKYLKATTVQEGLQFFPSYVPAHFDGAKYCIFNMINDMPEPVHNGGYTTGESSIQFDFYFKNLSDLDSAVESFKQIFVGQSIQLDTTVKMGYCESLNEFSEFIDSEKLYIRSVDLRIRYILN